MPRIRTIIHLLNNVIASQAEGVYLVYLINEKNKLCKGFLVDFDEDRNVFRFLANGFSAILEIKIDDIYTIWMHSDTYWRIALNRCKKLDKVEINR